MKYINDEEKIPLIKYIQLLLLYFIVTMAFFSLNQLRDLPLENIVAIKGALIQASVPSFLPFAIYLFNRHKRRKKKRLGANEAAKL